MTNRSISANLSLVAPSPYGSFYVYFGQTDIEDMLNPEFFIPEHDRLRAGDLLNLQTVARMNDGTNRVAATADAVVVQSARRSVEVRLRGKIIRIDEPEAEAPAPDDAQDGAERYVPGDCRIEHKGFGRFDVVLDASGEVVCPNVQGKEAAESIAAGRAPLPVAKAA